MKRTQKIQQIRQDLNHADGQDIHAYTQTRRRNFLRLGLVTIGSSFLTACDRLSNSEGFGKFLRNAQNLSQSAQKTFAGRKAMAQEFSEADVKAPFRANGATDPQGMKYKAFVADNFASWKLEVGGLVEKPMAFSLAELKAMPARTQITRHDCVEGWSQIAKWEGVPLHQILAQVKPLPDAKFVVFRCLDWVDAEDDDDVDGPDAEDSSYYESIDMDDAFHAQTILAYHVNGKPLPVANGAPIRLRVERQLGYKQAKYLMQIELVSSFEKIRGGNGGYWEDKGYEWYAGI